MYQRIVVPTDGSDTATAGLLEACRLAKELKAQLRVVHVFEEHLAIPPEMYGVAYDKLTEDMRAAAASRLHYAESLVKKSGVAVETQLLESMGTPAGQRIIDAAKDWPADLIVCGTHGRRGLRRIVMGSDAEYIVRHAPVPVLLIREDGWLKARQLADVAS